MREQSLATKSETDRTPLRLVGVENILDRIQQLRDAIARRAFEIFEGRGKGPGQELEDWLRAESELLHPIHVDVQESDDALIVCTDVLGFSAKEVEVSVEPRRVTVVGKEEASEKRKEGKKAVYTERHSTQIFRVLDLPAEVDPTKATATLKDGILELRMPRAAKAQKIRVEPKAA